MSSDGVNHRIFDWRWLGLYHVDPLPLLRAIVDRLGDKNDKVFRQMELELRLAERAATLGLEFSKAVDHRGAGIVGREAAAPFGYEQTGEPFVDLVCEHDLNNVIIPAIRAKKLVGKDVWEKIPELTEYMATLVPKDVKLRALRFLETTEKLTTDEDDPLWEGGLLADRDRWYSQAAIGMGVTIQQTTIPGATNKHVIKIENNSKRPVAFARPDKSSTVTLNPGYKGGLTENQINDSAWVVSMVAEPIKPLGDAT